VKEGYLHSIAQDYWNIPMETGQHYFCIIPYTYATQYGNLSHIVCVAQNIIKGHLP
jgi:hypothetical protein